MHLNFSTKYQEQLFLNAHAALLLDSQNIWPNSEWIGVKLPTPLLQNFWKFCNSLKLRFQSFCHSQLLFSFWAGVFRPIFMPSCFTKRKMWQVLEHTCIFFNISNNFVGCIILTMIFHLFHAGRKRL